jgi:hypothetical protein
MRQTLARRCQSNGALARFLTTILAGFLTASPVMSQAWVPAKGETSVSIAYQYARVIDHYRPDGSTVDVGHIWTHIGSVSLAYSPTDRLALSFGVPYVVARYVGDSPHQDHIDGGLSHGTWQDYRLDLRYQLVRGTTVVTPFIEAIIPTHDYEFFGHSAVGRRLNERTAGVYIGRPIGALLPNAYLQGRVSYSFVDQDIDIKANHANLDVDAGYFLTGALGVRVLVSLQRTDGGVDMNKMGPVSGEFYQHHDQIIRENHLNLGAGMSYAMTENTDVFFSALRTVQGTNGHKLDLSFTAGVGWTFTPRP